jgi:phospholipid/cholesterol/gamma-HCH transport system ATP-binding protein
MTAVQDRAVIEVRGLSSRLGGQRIHDGLDLEVHRREILALIGNSGSGKTVLLRHIIGLLTPVRGSVRVLGEDIRNLSGFERRNLCRRWGVLFQQGALFSAFTVFDNIAFPLRELHKDGLGMDEGSVREFVRLKLGMVGLEPRDAWKYPAELSGGMIKRVALARALALEPELLFLDEPTTGLDPISSGDFDALLLELHRELEFTVLMVTHDRNTLAAVSDRVAVLEDGRILAAGSLDEVAAFDHPYIKRFFHRRQGDEALRSLPTY